MQIKELILQAKGKPIVIAQYFIESLNNLVVCQGDLYLFNGKYYDLVERVEFGTMFLDFLIKNNISNLWSTNKEKEVLGAVMRLPSVKKVELDDYDNLINLNNGVLNLDTMEILPHHPDYFFSWAVNIDFDPTATSAPNFIRFMESTFNNDNDTIDIMLMIGGYLIYPRVKMEKMFVFLGNGANGKSTLINIYKMFFTKKFITSMSLVTLSGHANPAQRAQLVNSRLNIAAEEKGGRISSDEIKKIISGQDIDLARKFKEGINFTAKTKIIVDSNNVPYFDDTSNGTKRRLFIVNFINTYVSGKDWDKAVATYKNPNTYHVFKGENYEEMIGGIKKELPAVLNMFLAGLNRLRELNWQLPSSKHTEESVEEYEEIADSWKTWFDNNYQLDDSEDNFGIPFSQIYKEFDEWYIDNFFKHCPHSKVKFAKRLKDFYKVKPIKKYYRNNMGAVCCDVMYPLTKKRLEEIEIIEGEKAIDLATLNF